MSLDKFTLSLNPKYYLPENVKIRCKNPLARLNYCTGDSVVISTKAKNATQSICSPSVTARARRLFLRGTPKKVLSKFMNENFIKNSLDRHYDEISELLGQYGYKPKINMSHLADSKNHFLTTYNFAYNLTREHGFNLAEAERDNLLEAALLHDIGKALIPTEVFNKPGKFTPDERKVMDLHSELSYILLKDAGINKKTLSAIREHHHAESTGDVVTEILSLCDEASALKENRVYKKGFTDIKTIAILKEDSLLGKLDPAVVKTGLDIMSIA